MPKFNIERVIPGAGKFTATDLKAISQKSCGVLSSMGPSIQWIQSYVSDDKIHCTYQAPDEAAVRLVRIARRLFCGNQDLIRLAPDGLSALRAPCSSTSRTCPRGTP